MKLRQGFVSNSSSSSFVCAPKWSMEEVEERMETIASWLDISSFNHWELTYTENRDGNTCVTIDSSHDNSIPWCIRDFISEMFDAEYYHS